MGNLSRFCCCCCWLPVCQHTRQHAAGQFCEVQNVTFSDDDSYNPPSRKVSERNRNEANMFTLMCFFFSCASVNEPKAL